MVRHVVEQVVHSDRVGLALFADRREQESVSSATSVGAGLRNCGPRTDWSAQIALLRVELLFVDLASCEALPQGLQGGVRSRFQSPGSIATVPPAPRPR